MENGSFVTQDVGGISQSKSYKIKLVVLLFKCLSTLLFAINFGNVAQASLKVFCACSP